MHVHINHCFCTDSNWGGDYWGRYMVCWRETLTYDDALIELDWTNLLEEFPYFDKEEFDNYKKAGFFKNVNPEQQRNMCTRTTRRLIPAVDSWLKKNVKDFKGGSKKVKGFCVGTDKYNYRSSGCFTVWFQRRSDAMNFVKKWSSYKKPTTYFDYFKGVRKQLNMKTKTLQSVQKLTYI